MGATRQHPQPSFASRHRWAISRPAGFTLLEILLALAIVAVTAAMAIPSYERYRERVRTAQAVNDIANMGTLIARFATDSRAVPETLDEVGLAGKLDPWGRPYRYLNLTTKGGKGGARKDKKLNPLNSDFDLYSIGKDGETTAPLTPKVSHDDVVRALDGRFIGLAEDFDP
jgi:general secretion pathway protein G